MNEPPSKSDDILPEIDLQGMFWTGTAESGITLWYPDGDYMAEVEDNLGLQLVAADVALYLCSLPETNARLQERLLNQTQAINGYIDEIRRLQEMVLASKNEAEAIQRAWVSPGEAAELRHALMVQATQIESIQAKMSTTQVYLDRARANLKEANKRMDEFILTKSQRPDSK